MSAERSTRRRAFLALAIAAAGTSLFVALFSTAQADEPAPARLIVASVHADWCASCTLLAPKIAEIETNLAGASVRFVTLDFTDKDRLRFFAQADAAGVGDAARAYVAQNRNLIATGRVLMVEPISGERVGLMTGFQSRYEIEAAIKGWLGI